MIVSFDANIGAGKTTLLNALEGKLDPSRFKVVLEPVDTWLNKGNDNTPSIFELFYNNPSRYAFLFQMFALHSRFEKWENILAENKGKIILCERSMLTDYYIFAQMLHESKDMSDHEFAVYQKWYSVIKPRILPLFKHLIYLRVNPELCHARIQKRARKGEENITFDYITRLHHKHESWLNDNAHVISYDHGDINLCMKDVIEYLECLV